MVTGGGGGWNGLEWNKIQRTVEKIGYLSRAHHTSVTAGYFSGWTWSERESLRARIEASKETEVVGE